jgi:hypothetical protein
VPHSWIVLIAAPELLPALKQRAAATDQEILEFADTDALRALEVITARRPHIVALERAFADTPRGAALMNRIKADPTLDESEIRIVSHDSEYSRVAPREPGRKGSHVAAAQVQLDQRGTRRAQRFRVAGQVDVLVDGNVATLVDLSTLGAQVMSSTVLKPNQRVRMALNDDHGSVRFNASVAWASFEIPRETSPRYRAGLEFVDADGSAVDAFCARHKAK